MAKRKGSTASESAGWVWSRATDIIVLAFWRECEGDNQILAQRLADMGLNPRPTAEQIRVRKRTQDFNETRKLMGKLNLLKFLVFRTPNWRRSKKCCWCSIYCTERRKHWRRTWKKKFWSCWWCSSISHSPSAMETWLGAWVFLFVPKVNPENFFLPPPRSRFYWCKLLLEITTRSGT